ncbi:hypothetical protein SKAU_G00177390 [Synaphobranchus kaupii]|uniref:Uncharacterized protein n=1 Tax=Synaphobranchus kaupii TaxID=118154 RepID=A0A9Q1IZ68_SYNKA|nr:hypothetical protein SKAU_G00177390 [Synaphobranchus kaupii]
MRERWKPFLRRSHASPTPHTPSEPPVASLKGWERVTMVVTQSCFQAALPHSPSAALENGGTYQTAGRLGSATAAATALLPSPLLISPSNTTRHHKTASPPPGNAWTDA